MPAGKLMCAYSVMKSGQRFLRAKNRETRSIQVFTIPGKINLLVLSAFAVRDLRKLNDCMKNMKKGELRGLN